MASARLIVGWLMMLGLVLHRTDALISLSEVLDIIKVAKDVTVSLAKAWDLVDQNIDFSEVPVPILHKTENKLFGRIERINSKLQDLAERVDSIGTMQILLLNNVHLISSGKRVGNIEIKPVRI